MRQRFIILFLALAVAILALFSWRRFPAPEGTDILTPYSRPDQSLELTKQLTDSGLNLGAAPVILGDSIEASVSGYTVLFDANGDFKGQIRALQLVLSRLKMDSKTKTEIDLRFNKVIIR